MKENLICVVRIRGKVGIRKRIEETLNRIRLRKKYSCVLLKADEKNKKLLKKINEHIAYGEINPETLEKLIEKRAKSLNKKKIDAKEIIKGFDEGKKPEEMNLKPFFRLHPPRKGIESKKIYPQGVLGNHKDKINELIERML